jgi:hypothetical protein
MKIQGKFIVRTGEMDGEPYEYETSEIFVDGERIDPAQYQDAQHASDEFQWGYGGTGPAFTAYVLLLLATGKRCVADQYHQTLKWDHVSLWPFGVAFETELDILAWLDARMGLMQGVKDV